ncbi:MAG: YggU family protein [Desulfobacteraceae bacterium]|nr:MAG: YggU family protein [Desulfobacteraceae bacterium]
MMLDITENEKGLTFKIFVQPRSSQNEIKGLHGDALKVRLTAPPVDGAANKMCVAFLAKFFDVPKSNVEVVSGLSSRTKRICIRPEAGGKRGEEISRIKKKIELFTKP